MMALHVALDTVTLNHLLRFPRQRKRQAVIGTVLDEFIRSEALCIGVDPDSAIIDEWRRTNNPEYVEILVVRWFESGGLFRVERVGRYSAVVSKKLRRLGFSDTVDKLLVRVALVLKDRIVVSIDSDFWNPRRPREKKWLGDNNAPVAQLLRNELGISVHTLKLLLERLKK